MPLPTILTEAQSNLLDALRSANVYEYSYTPGDACCEDHNVDYESVWAADASSAARRLADAWLSATKGAEPDTQLGIGDMLSGLLQGDDFSSYPDLVGDVPVVEKWLSSARKPSKDKVRSILASELTSEFEKLVKPAGPDVEGAWQLHDREEDDPEWVVHLSPEDAQALAAAAFPN